MEPVDESLEAKLQELQAETDNLLVQVTRYRKQFPQIAAKNYSLSLDKCLQAIDTQLAQLAVPPPGPVDTDVPDGLLIEYAFKMEKLSQLKTAIPDIVSKLSRARQVLKEEGARAFSASAGSAADNDENATQNLSELINSQRRIERQLDLAAKITQQF